MDFMIKKPLNLYKIANIFICDFAQPGITKKPKAFTFFNILGKIVWQYVGNISSHLSCYGLFEKIFVLHAVIEAAGFNYNSASGEVATWCDWILRFKKGGTSEF